MTLVQTPEQAADRATASEVTRQLCAAAALDVRFARQVVDVLRREPHRAVAASPGVDLVPVAAHARETYWRWLRGDLALVALLLCSWATLPFTTSVAAVLTYLWLPVVFALLFMIRWRGEQIALSRLTPGRFNAERERSRAEASPDAAAIDDAQKGNATVYSGFSPFIGAGAPIGGWSFALSLEGSDNKPSTEFRLGELYQAVCENLDLGWVQPERRVFVDGRDVRVARLFRAPARRPGTSVSDAAIDTLRESSTWAMRYVACVPIIDWEGDLVVSVFLRFTVVGDTLYAETSYALLPPVKDKLRQLDRLAAESELRRFGSVLVRSFAAMFYRPWFALFVVGRELARWSERRGTRRELERRPAGDGLVDYGARVSIRELATEPRYSRYFQRLDKEMHVKIVERRVLDAIVSFLDEHGVDTSELKHRRETILNQGVMISGGDVKFENTQVGSRARMAVNQMRPGSGEGAA